MKNRFRKYYTSNQIKLFVIAPAVMFGITIETITIFFLSHGLNPASPGSVMNLFFTQTQNFIYLNIVLFLLLVLYSLLMINLAYRPLRATLKNTSNQLKIGKHISPIQLEDCQGHEVQSIIRQFNSLLLEMQQRVDENVNSIQDSNHEISTMLTGIKQDIDILRMYDMDDPLKVLKALNEIDDTIIGIKNIMSATIDLAIVEQKKDISKANYHEIDNLLNTFLVHKKRTYPDFDIHLKESDSKNLSLWIDQNHFFLAINPIVENAIRYSLDSNKVIINVRHSEEEVCISITNWGFGIEEKDKDRLFERYFRGSNVSKKQSGSGLGLAISSRVVNLYGGRIDINTKEDGETTFMLVFPQPKS